jgi:hypothetical protein
MSPKRCYLCSRILTNLNTDNPEDELCVNCSLSTEEYQKRLENEIKSSERYRKRKKT